MTHASIIAGQLCGTICYVSPPLAYQLSLYSERATFMKHAKHSRCQEVTLVDHISYDTAWWVGECSMQTLCGVGDMLSVCFEL